MVAGPMLRDEVAKDLKDDTVPFFPRMAILGRKRFDQPPYTFGVLFLMEKDVANVVIKLYKPILRKHLLIKTCLNT